MIELNNILETWSKKLSIPAEDIKSEYDKLVEEEKTIHTDLSEEEQQQRALKRLSLSYKRQLKSPAVGLEGIIIGTSDCVDMIARQRREALEIFKTDPQSAIAQGLTNEEGTPLDTRKEWNNGKANMNYGKPLPDKNLIRNIFGIAAKKSEGTPRFFSMSIMGDKASNENVPVFKPIRFMGIDKTPEEIDNFFKLNSSTFTNFEVDESLSLLKYMEIIKKYCGDMLVTLDKLNDYHQAEKDNYNRVAITIGDVSVLNLQPTSMGSRIMTIEKDSLDLDSAGVTCWVPQRCKIDFSEGSKVVVVGRTSQGKKKDEQGNPTEELSDVSINVYGMYAIPEYKITPPETTELTEENLEIN